jgi:hypothetical protein
MIRKYNVHHSGASASEWESRFRVKLVSENSVTDFPTRAIEVAQGQNCRPEARGD